MILEFAEQYHIPPWEFVEECTPYWWHRMVLRYKTIAEKQKDG